MTRTFLFFFFFFTCLFEFTTPAAPPPPPAINPQVAFMPVGVGSNFESLDYTSEFGLFSKELFQTCNSATGHANENFKTITGSSVTVSKDCDPRPDRVLLAQTATVVPKFEYNLKKDCELLVCSANAYPTGQAYKKAGKAVNYPPALPPNVNLCKDKLPAYPDGAGAVTLLFANEGNCEVAGNVYDKDSFIQVPRWWNPKDGPTHNVRTFFSAGQLDREKKILPFTRIPYIFTAPSDKGQLSFQECHSACDSGSVVKVQMNQGVSYSSLVWLDKNCPAFRVCFNPLEFENDGAVPKCYEGKEIDVMVVNGVVVWPGRIRSSLIELRSPKASVLEIALEFGFDKTGQFYVGNDHRERVTSGVQFAVADVDKLAFFFPTEKCLLKNGGIFSKNLINGKSLTSLPVVKGKVYNVQGEAVIPPGEVYDIVTTTTAAPAVIPRSTTPKPDVVGGVGAEFLVAAGAIGSNLESMAIYVPGKWWAWGIYIGFVIGTLLTLAIGGGLFYVLRRTIFGVWYRGMYKRYGCDPSGTTGGITGIGFGTTATGTVTIGGTTGGGTTATSTSTSGSTGTSTVGGTTAGGTTGGDGTTAAGSTIAM